MDNNNNNNNNSNNKNKNSNNNNNNTKRFKMFKPQKQQVSILHKLAYCVSFLNKVFNFFIKTLRHPNFWVRLYHYSSALCEGTPYLGNLKKN